jgi:PKD repeat protein
MRRIILLAFFLLPVNGYSQAILDSCFQSTNSGVSFSSSSTLANSSDADLVEWNGAAWTGSWPNANVDLPPPCNGINSRAIWMGDQTFWTTGGEGFSAKLSQSLVAGTTYSFTFTYASNGLYSNGNFSPYFKTNSSANYSTANLVGQLPAVGYDWETNTFSFTASSGQNGDDWILVHSNNGSGMVLSWCEQQINLGADTVLCLGDTITLSANAGFSSYTWNTGDTTSTIAVTSPGTYFVEESTLSCTQTDTIEIGYILCNVPQTAFESNDTALCEKFCIDFTDQSTNYPATWQWIFPGGNPDTSSAQNPANICYNLAGTFDVTLITTNINGSDTLTLSNYVTVYSTPPFPVITQVGYILTSSPATSYQWQFNTVDIAAATNQSYTISQSGLYTVIVSDSNGCKNSAAKYVLISGMDDLTGDANLSVFPNPADDEITVQESSLQSNEVTTIFILNVLGKIVQEEKVRWKDHVTLDVRNLPSGIYIVRMENEKEKFAARFVKE